MITNNQRKLLLDLIKSNPGSSYFQEKAKLEEYLQLPVSELYQKTTNKPWSTAKNLGFTSGSYDDNIALKQELKAQLVNNNQPRANSFAGNSSLININEAPTFNEAFKIARSTLGSNKIFEYKGRKYGTNLKGETFLPSVDTLASAGLNTPEIRSRLIEQNKLKDSVYSTKDTVKLEPEYKHWEEVKARNKELNKMQDAEMISAYYKNKAANDTSTYTVNPGENLSVIAKNLGTTVAKLQRDNNLTSDIIHPGQKLNIQNTTNQYLIVDKKRGVMHLYRDGEEITSFDILTGENPGDAQTVTKVLDPTKPKTSKADWSKGNKSTGAGVYTVSNINPNSRIYRNAPLFNLTNDQGIEVPTSIHAAPYSRDHLFGGENTRVSNGCINGVCKDLYSLKDRYGLKQGDKVFILPEDEGNTFEVVNDKIVLKSNSNIDYNNYIDSKGISRKGAGINKSYNTANYKPIKLVVNKEEFEKVVYNTSNYNDKEFNKTVIPFVNTLEKNKQKIMQVAKINGDVYNDIAKVAFGILGTETNFGDIHSPIGNLLRAANKVIDRENSSSPDYISKYSTYKANKEYNSIGLTQIREIYLDDSEREVLKELGIDSREDFLNPEKAALATAGILAMRYRNQLNSEQKKDILNNLPKTWNNRGNYVNRVISNSRYLDIFELN